MAPAPAPPEFASRETISRIAPADPAGKTLGRRGRLRDTPGWRTRSLSVVIEYRQSRMVHMLNRCPLDFGGRGRYRGCRPRCCRKQHVPKYMVPRLGVIIDAMPLNANGNCQTNAATNSWSSTDRQMEPMVFSEPDGEPSGLRRGGGGACWPQPDGGSVAR
jgi:hypothetical protein